MWIDKRLVALDGALVGTRAKLYHLGERASILEQQIQILLELKQEMVKQKGDGSGEGNGNSGSTGGAEV